MVVWVRRLRTFVLVSLNHPFNFEVQPARYSWKTFLFFVYITSCRYLPKELPRCRSICEVGKEFAYLHNLISSSLILAAKRIWWNHKSWGEVLISEAGENIQRLLLCVHAKDFPLKMFFAGTGGEDDKERERERKVFTNFALLLHGVNINKEKRIFELHIFPLYNLQLLKAPG